MLNQSTQHLIFSPTTSPWTSIDILLVDRTPQMVVQSMKRRKFSSAKSAFVTTTIPRSVCSDGLDVLVSWLGYHGSGDDVVSIKFLHGVVDFVAVEARRAGARFEVYGQAGCSGVGILAPRAGNVTALVNARVHMLQTSQRGNWRSGEWVQTCIKLF